MTPLIICLDVTHVIRVCIRRHDGIVGVGIGDEATLILDEAHIDDASGWVEDEVA